MNNNIYENLTICEILEMSKKMLQYNSAYFDTGVDKTHYQYFIWQTRKKNIRYNVEYKRRYLSSYIRRFGPSEILSELCLQNHKFIWSHSTRTEYETRGKNGRGRKGIQRCSRFWL